MQCSAFHCVEKHINKKTQKNISLLLLPPIQISTAWCSAVAVRGPPFFCFLQPLEDECVCMCVWSTHTIFTHTFVSISCYQSFPCTMISSSVVFACMSLLDLSVFCDVLVMFLQSDSVSLGWKIQVNGMGITQDARTTDAHALHVLLQDCPLPRVPIKLVGTCSNFVRWQELKKPIFGVHPVVTHPVTACIPSPR